MLKKHSYLGVHVTHDASICQVTGGEIDWFVEEERYSGIKHDRHPLTSVMEVDISPDISKTIQVSGLYEPHNKDYLEDNAKFFTTILSKKYAKTISILDHEDIQYEFYELHHDFHAACGFYNSGFARAAVLVVDGMGNPLPHKKEVQEVETIFSCTYPNQFKKHSVGVTPTYLDADKYDLSFGIGMVYHSLSKYFGFGDFGSGKLMGLSSYGVEDENIKPFVNDDFTLDTNLFCRNRFGLTFLPYEYVRYPKGVNNFMDLDDELKVKFSNLAYRVQKDFERYMSNLILRTLEVTGETNIVLTGGCALNCVANYEYLKILPKGVKLYVEPISTDAGTSIGLAKLDYYSATKSTSRHKLKTLYLGKER